MFTRAQLIATMPPEVQKNPRLVDKFFSTLTQMVRAEIVKEAEAADREQIAFAKQVAGGVRVRPGLGELRIGMPTAIWDYFRRKEQYDPGSREDRATLKKVLPAAIVKTLPSGTVFPSAPVPRRQDLETGRPGDAEAKP